MEDKKKFLRVHEILKAKVAEWRSSGYKEPNFPAISEILCFNFDAETGRLGFLRKAQFEALETYWYLRLVEKTPHVFELYKRLFTDPVALAEALGVPIREDDFIRIASEGGINLVFEKVRTDATLVEKYKLETLYETLSLPYPSYVFALAMGAGKTVLIGSIIATEFAMALEYPEGPFVKNALVFAPGKTVVGALKELSEIPYEKVLPQRLHKKFASAVKFTYTRDEEKDVPIVWGSCFNVVVTNTEKIRIQKHTITKSLIKDLLAIALREDDVRQEVANRRLQTIASLPNLAVFSDEAHHTYGIKLREGLKRVRQTVNYLSQQTNLIVVVNTTGTPYYGKQLLKDVVYWYGLSQGIRDGILKEVRGNVVSYEDVSDEVFVREVILDFFKHYKDVKTYDGSSAKIAIYFPQVSDLRRFRPVVEKTLLEIGVDPLVVLEVHSGSDPQVQDLFDNRVNDPSLPYRVFLLVNKGTEGWNCPSLFATALARELKASNNFCLQAACRCLRQVPGNNCRAKIYVSSKNVKVLNSQLEETYGETLRDLNEATRDAEKKVLVVRKTEIPPILLRKKILRVVPVPDKNVKDFESLEIVKPQDSVKKAKKVKLDFDETHGKKGVLVVKDVELFELEEDFVDAYSFAVELSSTYRLPLMQVYKKLKPLYPDNEIPVSHAEEIRRQVEEKVRSYEVKEEVVEVALALIKLQGFEKQEKDGKVVYVTEITYRKDKEHLLLRYEDLVRNNKHDFGFHYTPYNFDSKPEKDFFEQILRKLNEDPADVEDIYYTGAITDPNKTDFLFEYKGSDGKWHVYTPDFLIKKKDGKMVIVEVKSEPFKGEEKEKAIREVEGLNPDKLKYEILITSADYVGFENVSKILSEVYGSGGKSAGR